MMISEARKVEIKLYVWDKGGEPAESVSWDGPTNDFDRIVLALCERLETKEYGKIVRRYSATEEKPEDEFVVWYRAFTDPHRGRQIVSGMSPEDADEAFEQCKQECAARVFTPIELYTLKPVRVDYADFHTVAVHLPEINQYELDFDGIEAGRRFETRTIVDHDYDGRRGWTLQTVWFDGKPVMVVNSSGRDGDEYHQRWVTNLKRFRKLLTWLRTFVPSTGIDGLVKANLVIPSMTEFYGATIHDYYDVDTQEPKK
jgi:hypothetical protein